ncbi:MAG: hypothetical protein V1775_00190 [Bacteroidota bacterium]
MDLTEFCKDMPERQPVDPKDYIPIDMYPGYTFYIGKKTDLQHQTLMLKHLAGSDLRELKRLLEQWFQLYPDKKYLIRQIRKCTISLRRGIRSTNILYKVTPDQLDVLSKFVDEHTVSLQKDNSTPPEGLQCIEGIKPEDLKFIYAKLMGSGRLHKSVTVTNFVTTFQAGALPVDWKPIKWTGKNPELATLVNQLTGLRPIPSIVKPLFQTETEYENVNSSRINNKPIIELVAAALK